MSDPTRAPGDTTSQFEAPDPARSQPRVLVVDDEPIVVGMHRKLLMREGYTVEIAGDGKAALEAVTRFQPHVVLLDVMLPGASGIEICRKIKADHATRLTPVIIVTGLADRDKRIEGLDAGADDFLNKPVDQQELLARVRSLVRMKRYTDDLDSAASILMTMAVLIEGRDGNSEGHCHRMANHATALGRALSLDDERLRSLYRGGFLHDIGMLAIPDSIMRKPGPLTQEEFELVRSHTVIGEKLCGNLRSLENVRPIIRHHHERYDGTGYPDGLKGDAIPLGAQIISIVDTYDALTRPRPYQGVCSAEQALGLLRDQAEKGWRRPDIVETFIGLVESGRLDTFRP